MTAGMSPMTPGLAGWVLGGLLLSAGVRILLGLRRRRRAARRAALATRWHPSKGPRPPVDAATVLLPRACDQLDATMLIPRQRGASR